jgi:tetratricopeptide (TPR) repeat protein
MERVMRIMIFVTLLFGAISGLSVPAEGEVTVAEWEKNLKLALRNDPGDYAAMAQLGSLYWGMGRRTAAIIQFRKALRINPDYPIPYYFLGEAYYLERKPEKAMSKYRLFTEKMDAIQDMDEALRDYYVSTLHKMGGRFWSMKEYNASVNLFNRIVELDPEDPKAHYNLAVCYYNHLNNRSRAFAELNKVIEMAPESRTAAKAEFFIDYMRRNPDARIIGDFSFIDEE